MSGNVNIGRTDDPAYRYKMPRVIGKVEGRGNGIKTVVVNCIEIGQALHRDPDELNKFFGTELGALTTFDEENEKAIVNGAHKDDVLQELVDLYVDKFVLCPTCKLPETSYKYKLKSGDIFHKCKACGASDGLVDPVHKLCKFIINKRKKFEQEKKKKAKGESKEAADSPDAKAAKKAKKAAKKAKKEAKKEKKRQKKLKKKAKKKAKEAKAESSSNSSKSSEEAEAAGEIWASEGAPAMKQDMTIVTASPAEAMTRASADLSTEIVAGKDNRRIITRLGELRVNYRLQPADCCGILFTAAFKPCVKLADFITTFNRFKSLFRQHLREDDSELFASIDRHFTDAENSAQLAAVAIILKVFHDEELISNESVEKWYAQTAPYLDRYNMVNAEALQAVKAKASAFVDQLDSDSESDSSSD